MAPAANRDRDKGNRGTTQQPEGTGAAVAAPEARNMEEPKGAADVQSGAGDRESDEPESAYLSENAIRLNPQTYDRLPICAVDFARAKNSGVKGDAKRGYYCQLVSVLMQTYGPNGSPSPMVLRASIGARWGEGEKRVKPFLQMPSGAGRGTPGLDTDDHETQAQFDKLCAEITAWGLKWQKEHGAKASAAIGIDAADLGINIG